MDLVGSISTDAATKGLWKEGKPPLFPMIDNFVLYVEGNKSTSTPNQYSATIRYSCKEGYKIGIPPFYYPLFESVQIWTREKVVSEDELDRLVAVADSMGIIGDLSKLRNNTFAGCS
jgi:hypothetical protein